MTIKEHTLCLSLTSMQLSKEVLQISQQIIKNTSGNSCNGRLTLQNFMTLNLRKPVKMLKTECWNIGLFVGNDDKSRDISPHWFKSRDQSDFENAYIPFGKICQLILQIFIILVYWICIQRMRIIFSVGVSDIASHTQYNYHSERILFTYH